MLEFLATLGDSSSASLEPDNPLLHGNIRVAVCRESRELTELIWRSYPAHGVHSYPVHIPMGHMLLGIAARVHSSLGSPLLQCKAAQIWTLHGIDERARRAEDAPSPLHHCSAAMLVSPQSADRVACWQAHSQKSLESPTCTATECFTLPHSPSVKWGQQRLCWLIEVFRFCSASRYQSVHFYCLQVKWRFSRLVQSWQAGLFSGFKPHCGVTLPKKRLWYLDQRCFFISFGKYVSPLACSGRI